MGKTLTGFLGIQSRKIQTFESSLQHRGSRFLSNQRLKKSPDTSSEIGFDSLKAMLPIDAFIIEVGLFTGGDTEKFVLCFPNAEIHGFEADLQNFSKAYERLRHYPNVQITCAAISSGFGVSSFFSSHGDSRGAGSILPPSTHLEKWPKVTFDLEGQQLVPTIPLTSYLTALNFARTAIDLLWIDVQGAELLVLEGMGDYLEKCRYIYLEVSSVALYEGGTTHQDIQFFLTNRGFVERKKFLGTEPDAVGNIMYERMEGHS